MSLVSRNGMFCLPVHVCQIFENGEFFFRPFEKGGGGGEGRS